MRAFQERYARWDGVTSPAPSASSLVAWPNAADGTPAPAFPPDGFYADHAGAGSPSTSYNAAVNAMNTKLGTAMGYYVTDPQWANGRTTPSGSPTISGFYGGSSYTSSVSSKTAQEKLDAIQEALKDMDYLGGLFLATKSYSPLLGTGEGSTKAEAWAEAQVLYPNPSGSVTSVLYSFGSRDTPTVYSATLRVLDLSSSINHAYWKNGTARMFGRFVPAQSTTPLASPAFPSSGVYAEIPVGGQLRFAPTVAPNILDPAVVNPAGYSKFSIADQSTFEPVMNHPASPDDDPGPTCQTGGVLGSAHYSWSAGRSRFGELDAKIELKHDRPSTAWYSPDTLITPAYHGYASIRDSAKHLLQIYGPTQVVDVANVTALGYDLKFYHRDPAWAINPDGRVAVPPTATPHLISRVENPDASGATNNQLKVIETRGTNVKWWLFVFDYALQQWTKTSSEEAETETLVLSNVNASGEWTEDRVLASANGAIVSRVLTTWKNFAWGREKIGEVVDPPGLARITTWSFYTNQAAPPSGDGYQNYGQLKQKTFPNGSWERYSYDSIRRIKKIVSTYQNAPITAPDDQCRVIEFTYPSDFAPATDYTMIVEKVAGIETARRYRRDYWDGNDDIVCVTQGAAIDAADNLVTKTRYYQGGIFAGRLKSVTRPDGTMAIYSYSANAAALDDATELTTTASEGQPNAAGSAIIDGTTTMTLTNRQGFAIHTIVQDVSGGHIIAERQAIQVDDFGRPVAETNLDGTSELTVYNCCEVESWTDKRGLQTSYGNTAGLKTRTSLGVTWKDKTEGREQIQTRTGSDGAEVEISRQERNVAGELIRTVSPASGTTFRSQSFSPTEVITSLAYADGGTEVRAAFLDGQLKSITGSAVFPKRYEYGVNANGTRWTKVIALDAAGTDTAEWTKTTTDVAGRVIAIEGADGSVASRFYNAKNQLIKTVDPDGVTLLSAYDDRGRLWRTALDMDRNGVTDLGGTDRVTETTSLITTRPDGRAVNRSTVKLWTTDNDANATVITSTTDAAADGLDSWSVVGGVETHVQTAYQGGGNWTVTTTDGDGSTSTSTYTGGRLASEIRRTNTGAVIASTTYGYDVRGRVQQTVNGLGGVTDIAYDAADRIQTVTGPDPGDGNPRPMSTYGYDAAGRQNSVTDVAGGTTLTVFNPNGTIQSSGGTRQYPLGYTYTPQGRMETMTTAAGVTSWQYHPSNGLLWKKFEAGALASTYTYTAAGRPLTRVNGRGITTTYGYDFAGGQTAIDFADATPDIGRSYNRLGLLRTAARGGITRTLSANAWGQLTQEDWSGGAGWDGLALVHGRDALRRRNTLTVNSGAQALTTQGFAYDGASRLSTVTDGDDAATYAYVPGSSLVDTITHSRLAQVQSVSDRNYNAAGRLEEIRAVNAANALLTQSAYQHDSIGRRTSATREDGAKWTWDYNERSEVTTAAQSFSDGSAHPFRQYAYAYDGIGNRTTASRAGHTESYATNSRNQYTQRTMPGVQRVEGEAEADASVIVNAQPAARHGTAFWKEWDADNSAAARWDLARIVAAKPGAGPNGEDLVSVKEGHLFLPQTPEAFMHDSDGNLTRDGRWNYTWDGENRLVAMETRGDIAATVPRSRLEFDYDDMGRRIAKRVFGWNPSTSAFELSKSLRFLYDGWNPVAEFEGGATDPLALKRTYTWGTDLSGSSQGAGGVGGLLFVSVYSSAAPYVLSARLTPAFDGNGNVIAWLDAGNGAVAVAFDYDAFGNLLAVLPHPLASAADAAAIPIGFSTKYRDAETGLLHYGFRDYSPPLGRWLSQDPLGEAGGVNLYGFVSNNAVNAVDALGLLSEAYSIRDELGVTYTQDHPFVTQADKCGQDWVYLDRLDLWVRLTTLPDPCCPKERFIEGPRFKQMEDGALQASQSEPDEEVGPATPEELLAKAEELRNRGNPVAEAKNRAPEIAGKTLGALGNLADAGATMASWGELGGLKSGAKAATNLLDDAAKTAQVESRALVPYSGQATPTSWPGNSGFLTGPSKATLSPGTIIDRYGAGTGTYVAPAGTPFGMRGLPAAYETTQPLNTYRVLQPIEVNAGNAAPAFGQPGLGTQYELPFSVNDLIELKVLAPH